MVWRLTSTAAPSAFEPSKVVMKPSRSGILPRRCHHRTTIPWMADASAMIQSLLQISSESSSESRIRITSPSSKSTDSENRLSHTAATSSRSLSMSCFQTWLKNSTKGRSLCGLNVKNPSASPHANVRRTTSSDQVSCKFPPNTTITPAYEREQARRVLDFLYLALIIALSS